MAKLHKLGGCYRFLRPLLILVRQRRQWSPLTIVGELWRLLTNIGIRREILDLLTLPPFDKAVQDNPGLALKYVIPDYLAQSFTVAERASCFLHHYRRMHAALSECVLRDLLQGDVTLHEFIKHGNRFTVASGLARPPFDKEGELSLSLKVNGKEIFVLTFIIVPGWAVESEAEEILLITGLQGARGSNPQVRLMRNYLQEYSSRKLLLAALQGVAEAFGISEVGAVCAANQRSYGKGYDDILESGYDNFFATLGMTRTSAGFYSCSIPIEDKPVASFRGRDRRRAKKRRAIRSQMQSASASFFLRAAD